MSFPQSLLPRLAGAGLALTLASVVYAQTSNATPYYFSTFVGVSALGATDGPGASARFYRPAGIAIDSAGNAYVTDAGNNTIRKITPAGVVSTLAGTPGTRGNADGLGPAARFDIPWAITIDLAGNLFVADTGNDAIRKITPQGEVTTAVQKTDTGINEIDLFLAAGRISAATASVPRPIFNGWRYHPYHNNYNAVGLDTYFGRLPPPSLATDSAGNAYTIFDGTVKKIGPSGTSSTLAGTERQYGSVDGVGSAARFSYTLTPATDLVGNVYIADQEAGTIRKITPAGEVTTIAGTSDLFDPFAPNRDSSTEYFDRPLDGDRTTARFGGPNALAVTPSGDILVAEESTIRCVTATGTVRPFAGLLSTVQTGTVDGTGSDARGYWWTVTMAGDGCLYGAGFGHTIRKVTPAGVVTTLVSQPRISGGSNDTDSGGAAEAIAADRNGNLYVAYYGDYTIYKVTPAGVVTTFAGQPGVKGTADGSGSAATFQNITSIAVDATGNIFASCYDRNFEDFTLRKITPAGAVTTLDTPPGANLEVDQRGNLYTVIKGPKLARIAEDGTQTVVLDLSESWVIDPGPTGQNDRSFGHFAFDAEGNVIAFNGFGLLRKISPAGTITDIGGEWSLPFHSYPPRIGPVDGLGANARFEWGQYGKIAIDTTGTLYISSGRTIRKGQLAGPVTITAQPQSQSAIIGTNVQLSVTATGVPAPSYQWRFNGTPISGATAATLHLPAVSTANAGDYTVVATNDLGSATSSAAALTVSAAPVTPTTPAAPSSGGGGALGGWFALGLLALGSARRRAHRSARAC